MTNGKGGRPNGFTALDFDLLDYNFESREDANTSAGEDGLLTKSAYSKRARKYKKTSCEACGSKKKMVTHHIDQERTNNEPDNIQTLCKTCHDFFHRTARRNGKHPAGKMAHISED